MNTNNIQDALWQLGTDMAIIILIIFWYNYGYYQGKKYGKD